MSDQGSGPASPASPALLSRRWCEVHSTHSPRIDRAGGLHTIHLHHIQPQADGGPDTQENIVAVCPTGHDAIHELLRAWNREGGKPRWPILRHYHPRERALAQQGFEAIQRSRT
jgi:hypothetical protein